MKKTMLLKKISLVLAKITLRFYDVSKNFSLFGTNHTTGTKGRFYYFPEF